ncbi:MAG TPA: YqcC family protein [Pseudomonas sabulinigri]|uniref:YqcC-like domain-containing protein n=1 Tax=marine sediment metagenome TaxID=412755 RepID=A0A0F9U3E3_9ZZZZ|nr:YqcC family protein [Halopseudomonas sabulinigri]HEC51385.1 YqcC family protein [Halopseudomonas sabulinigri]
MRPDQWAALADALLALESELRSLGLWSEVRPEPERLSSTTPFCVDTLDFEHWLQWVFIPRMVTVINQRASLPAKCEIQPVAEVAFAPFGRRKLALLLVIAEVDRLTSLLAQSKPISQG